MRIKLPILFYNENDAMLSELGVKITDTETRQIIFFTIDRIEQHYRDGKECTLIVSNGEEMICPLKIKEVEVLISAKELSKYLQTAN